MPVDGLWTVRLAVTRRILEDTNGARVVFEGGGGGEGIASNNASLASSTEGFDHDPTDWVSIRMGSAVTSLIDVASVKNVVNEDLGEVSAGNMEYIKCRREVGAEVQSICFIVVGCHRRNRAPAWRFYGNGRVVSLVFGGAAGRVQIGTVIILALLVISSPKTLGGVR